MDTGPRAQELLHVTELQLKRNTQRSFPLEAEARNLSGYCHCTYPQYGHADMNTALTVRCRKSAETCDI
jgi:hypothetical protein